MSQNSFGRHSVLAESRSEKWPASFAFKLNGPNMYIFKKFIRFWMRIVLIILAVFQGAFLATGQPTHLKNYIDSLNRVSFDIRTSDRPQSIEAAKSAIAMSEGRYEEGLMRGYLNLGLNLTNLNRFDSALYYLRICENYFEDPSFELGLVKFYMGINFSNLRDFDKANAYFDKSEELFGSSSSVEFLAYVQNSRGIVEGRQSHYDAALAFFLNAYEIKLDNELPYDEELTNISIVYRLMKRYDKAIEFARKSLQMSIDLNDSLGITQTYISIAKIFGKTKEVDSANYYFDLAYDLSIRNGYTRQAPSALINKSDVLLDAGQPREAIRLLRKAVSISKVEDDALESAFFELAMIFSELGQLDSAITYALRSHNLCATSSNLGMCQSNAKLLAQAYERKGDMRQALEYLKLYQQYTEELVENNNQSEISDLRIRIETLENEQEIERLNQASSLDRLRRQQLLLLLIAVIIVGGLLLTLLIYRHRVKSRQNALEQQKLKAEVEKAQNDLYQQTLHMVQMNNCLNDIESQIKSTKEVSRPLNSILKTIKVNKSLDKEWEHFNQYFGSVHDHFFERLIELSSGLSNHEQRVCALIRLNMSNREIATLLNIENRSVVMLKYRIKKKLNLKEEVDLKDFLVKM